MNPPNGKQVTTVSRSGSGIIILNPLKRNSSFAGENVILPVAAKRQVIIPEVPIKMRQPLQCINLNTVRNTPIVPSGSGVQIIEPQKRNTPIFSKDGTNVIIPEVTNMRKPLQPVNLNILKIPNSHIKIPKPLKRGEGSVPSIPSTRQCITTVLSHKTVTKEPVLTISQNRNVDCTPVFPSLVKICSSTVKNFHQQAATLDTLDFSTINAKKTRPSKSLSLRKNVATTDTAKQVSAVQPLSQDEGKNQQPEILSLDDEAPKQSSESLTLEKNIPFDALNSNSEDFDEASSLSRIKILQELLEEILPPNYSHKIVSVEPLRPYHKMTTYDESEMLTAEVRVNLKSKEEALKWLEDFKKSSFTDWRVRRNFKENTKCIIYKKGFRCHHNTLSQYRHNTKQAHKKQTECDASISITVKNYNMTRSSDKYLKSYPCEIIIQHCHNHPTVAGDSARYRRPSPAIIELFTDMFRRGHSPSTALHTHQYDIQIAYPDTFFEVLGDGAQCPNMQWCYHLYRKIFQKEYGAPTGIAMVESLKAAVQKYNEECGSLCAKVETFQDSDIVIALCSPLMKRVHQLKSSGEMGFLDSGGCMDRHNTRIFTFLAPSLAGALPTGVVMTSSESAEVLGHGISMLKSILPPNAFCGRGAEKGPELMMTDDSSSERSALETAFHGIILLLCYFHILNAFWQYIWATKHKVDANDRVEIYLLFKEWSRAEPEADFKKKYQELLCHPKIVNNKILVKHLNDLCARAPEWALCYRSDLLTRGNNTNNYSESTILQYKDQVVNRVKAYSEVQLFDFFITRVEAYFERRIAAVLNNRKESYWKSRHFISPLKIVPLRCAESSIKNVYVVRNVERNTQYTVDMEIEMCSCPVGKNGAPCKHQFAVVKQFNLSSSQFLPYEDESAKILLHRIMTTAAARPGWYASLKAGPVTSSSAARPGWNAALQGGPVTTSSGKIVSDEDTSNTTDDSLGFGNCAPETSVSENIKESVQPVDRERHLKVLEAWNAVDAYIRSGLEERPDVFLSAVEKFSANFTKAKALSENAVISAMHTFSNNAILGDKTVRRGRYIKVNYAAKVRRKYASLGGRKVTRQGRPPKSAFTSEHGYAIGKPATAAWDGNGQKRSVLPHNISYKVIQSQYSARKNSVPKKND